MTPRVLLYTTSGYVVSLTKSVKIEKELVGEDGLGSRNSRVHRKLRVGSI